MIFSPSWAVALTFALVVYVLPASVLGAIAGSLTSAVLRQEWGERAAALDILFASVLMVLSMFGSCGHISQLNYCLILCIARGGLDYLNGWRCCEASHPPDTPLLGSVNLTEQNYR
jgi:hypothetical protein